MKLLAHIKGPRTGLCVKHCFITWLLRFKDYFIPLLKNTNRRVRGIIFFPVNWSFDSFLTGKYKCAFFRDHKNVTLSLSWNVIPNAGNLPRVGAHGTHSFKFPSEYTTARVIWSAVWKKDFSCKAGFQLGLHSSDC